MSLFGFSSVRREIRDIAIAVIVLTLAFSIANFVRFGFHVTPYEALRVLSVSLLAVCLAFILHELAHRQLARRYGGYAEFRVWPVGLLFSLFFSVFGFVAAAPGAVYMGGIYGRERVGKTALGGPATNIILGFIFMFAGMLLLQYHTFSGISASLSQINFYLAAFNLVPFPPLDGQKVLAWDVRVFAAAFAIAIVMTVVTSIFI